ncbi:MULTISPECIES: DUF1127 domain-containing protein [Aurantimonas]
MEDIDGLMTASCAECTRDVQQNALLLCSAISYVMAIENPKPWNQDLMFRRLTTRLNTYRNHRNQIRQLEMMDDRELADIGVGRSQITQAVRFGRL